jgi:hypothetical protein
MRAHRGSCRHSTAACEGLTKGVALKETMLEVRKRYPHPYERAPFVLMGGYGSWGMPDHQFGCVCFSKKSFWPVKRRHKQKEPALEAGSFLFQLSPRSPHDDVVCHDALCRISSIHYQLGAADDVTLVVAGVVGSKANDADAKFACFHLVNESVFL